MADDAEHAAGGETGVAHVEAALARLLGSPLFANAARQRDLLRHLVCLSLAGDTKRLKGYTIAVEAFGREHDFDPMTNAHVRVEAARLRTRLRDYYEGPGRDDPLVFELPKGSYVMRFLRPERPPAPPAAGAGSLIAVLPFLNLDPDGDGERFVDGITDSVIFELSRLTGLAVAPRQASFATKGSDRQADELARELGARHLLSGTVRRTGEAVSVMARLDDPLEQRTLWSKRYDSAANDALAQDRLARGIAHDVQVQFTPSGATHAGHDGTASIDAHDALLRGIAGYHRFSPQSIPEVRRLFEEAIACDPGYAAAHAWLARTLTHQWIMRWGNFSDALRDEALAHAGRAVALDDQLSFAHTVLGWVWFWLRDKDKALFHCRRGVALDPHNPEPLSFLSMVLSSAGCGEEALVFAERARRPGAPSSPFYEFVYGQALYVLRNFEAARAAFERGCAMSDSFVPNHGHLCITYAQLGMMEAMRDKANYFLAVFGGDRARTLATPWLDEALETEYVQLMVKAGLR